MSMAGFAPRGPHFALSSRLPPAAPTWRYWPRTVTRHPETSRRPWLALGALALFSVLTQQPDAARAALMAGKVQRKKKTGVKGKMVHSMELIEFK
jgi:hypothetical protein